jgi:aspartokinase-like uncharacterized kinase
MLATGRLSGPGLTATSELALDQTAVVLADKAPGLVAVRSVRRAEEVAAGGATPVLMPATLLQTADAFRNTNRVSSGSMAAWLAVLLRIPRLVMVTSRLTRASRVSALRDDDLVDEVFPDLVPGRGLRCRICVPDRGVDALAYAVAGATGGAGCVDLDNS